MPVHVYKTMSTINDLQKYFSFLFYTCVVKITGITFSRVIYVFIHIGYWLKVVFWKIDTGIPSSDRISISIPAFFKKNGNKYYDNDEKGCVKWEIHLLFYKAP